MIFHRKQGDRLLIWIQTDMKFVGKIILICLRLLTILLFANLISDMRKGSHSTTCSQRRSWGSHEEILKDLFQVRLIDDLFLKHFLKK